MSVHPVKLLVNIFLSIVISVNGTILQMLHMLQTIFPKILDVDFSLNCSFFQIKKDVWIDLINQKINIFGLSICFPTTTYIFCFL